MYSIPQAFHDVPVTTSVGCTAFDVTNAVAAHDDASGGAGAGNEAAVTLERVNPGAVKCRS